MYFFVYLLAKRNVQPSIGSPIYSFIYVSKKPPDNGKQSWAEEPWLKFIPSSLSLTSILNKKINFIPELNLVMCLAIGCNL